MRRALLARSSGGLWVCDVLAGAGAALRAEGGAGGRCMGLVYPQGGDAGTCCVAMHRHCLVLVGRGRGTAMSCMAAMATCQDSLGTGIMGVEGGGGGGGSSSGGASCAAAEGECVGLHRECLGRAGVDGAETAEEECGELLGKCLKGVSPLFLNVTSV